AVLPALAGRLEPAEVGKVIARLVRQTVGFVKDVDGVVRRRKNGAAAEGEIRQHQIVIGNNAVDAVDLLAGFEKTATADKGTAPAAALAVIAGKRPPFLFAQRLRPVVPVTVPFPTGQAIHHGLVEGATVRRRSAAASGAFVEEGER